MAAEHGGSVAGGLGPAEGVGFPVCPFPLPQGEDHLFLLQQRLGSRAHKNISYDPQTGKTSGYAAGGADQADRLRRLLATFADNATRWLAGVLPRYAQKWQ